MRFRLTGLRCSRGARYTAVNSCWHVLPVIPVTLTVLLGPPLTMVYRAMESPDVGTGGVSLAQAVRGCLCLLLFISLALSGRLSLLGHRLNRPLLFLAVCATVTSCAGPYPYQNIVFAVKLAFIALVFAGAFQLAEDRRVGQRWLTACAWIVLLFMVMNTVIGLATGRTVAVYRSRYATGGLVGQPGLASALMMSALPVLLQSVFHSGSATAGVVLLFAALFFTMRRSSLIAGTATVYGVLALGLSPFGPRIPRVRALILALALILPAVVMLPTPAGEDLTTRFRDLNPKEGTGSGRYIFWRASLEHIVNRPLRVQLQGEGMGSIRDVIRPQTGLAIGAHNDWLDVVHSFGILGLIGISWWYLELAGFALRLRSHRDGPFHGVCATLILLGLISVGSGGSWEPSWALSYAALGFWAGRTERILTMIQANTPSRLTYA